LIGLCQGLHPLEHVQLRDAGAGPGDQGGLCEEVHFPGGSLLMLLVSLENLFREIHQIGPLAPRVGAHLSPSLKKGFLVHLLGCETIGVIAGVEEGASPLEGAGVAGQPHIVVEMMLVVCAVGLYSAGVRAQHILIGTLEGSLAERTFWSASKALGVGTKG